MGQRISFMVHNNPQLELAAAFEHPDSPAVGRDVGENAGFGRVGVSIAPGLESVIDKGDVIIDFTFHQATMGFVQLAAQHQRAMVIGTTGLTPENLAGIGEQARSSFPCVQAPNMAVGVNVLFKLVEKAAAILGDAYDVEIVEAHHRMKKDAPSGTALKLGEMAAGALNRDLAEVGVFERNGIIGERTDKEIGIQTIGPVILSESIRSILPVQVNGSRSPTGPTTGIILPGARPWRRHGWRTSRMACIRCSMYSA